MNARIFLPVTLISIATLTSCADSCKRPAEPTSAQTEPAAKSTPTQASRKVAGGKVIHFDELVTRDRNATDTINDTLKNNPKVVLDFYAEWCGPCKKLAPVLDKLAPKYPDVLFIKINTDDFGSLSEQFSVKGIPALFFYKDGKQVAKDRGFKDESQMKALLAKLD